MMTSQLVGIGGFERINVRKSEERTDPTKSEDIQPIHIGPDELHPKRHWEVRGGNTQDARS